jgi:hypothetical protein
MTMTRPRNLWQPEPAAETCPPAAGEEARVSSLPALKSLTANPEESIGVHQGQFPYSAQSPAVMPSA